MLKIPPFAIHKTLIGIGGEPKSVKRLHSGDLLIETTSALQTKFFLLAKSFLNNPVTISPHKTLNSCRDVISEPDLMSTPESEILEDFSNQGVTQLLPLTIAASSLSTETRLFATTSNKFFPLSTEVQSSVLLSQLAATISNSEPSDTSKIPKSVKQNSKKIAH
ncbi:uncharacterized protein TNCV_4111051 [Trichonephila clavipes]|nr:uncharacterized protein TNCV_4111051 [Trichonephila clavipes]